MAHTFTSSLHRPALHRPALHRRARSGATVIAGPDRFSRPPSVPTTSIAPRLRTFCSRRLSSGSARLEVVNPGPSLRDPGEELSSDDGVERDRRGKWTVAGGGHHVAPVLGHDDLAGQVADPAWSAHALRWRARPDASTCGRVTSGANTPAERLRSSEHSRPRPSTNTQPPRGIGYAVTGGQLQNRARPRRPVGGAGRETAE